MGEGSSVEHGWVTAGMERPKDDYKESHNVRLASQDTLFGGQVSRLQVTFINTPFLTSSLPLCSHHLALLLQALRTL